ncbi:MAG TPA: hypothetical protein VG943_00025 [Caulobacterales bacterium]|nr:hypothetical protein [Caulobacterales bacterium]
MARKLPRRFWTWLAAIVAVIVTIVALNWQWFALSAAFVLAERRPALLANAQWDQPARKFSEHFHAGTGERELLAWLESNKFTVERGARHATRLISSLPCNEFVDVRWQASGETINAAEARVSEAGCL